MSTSDFPPEIPPVAAELFEGSQGTPFEDAGATASIFLLALEDPVENAPALGRLTTPESQAAWGDFREAAAWLAESSWSVGSIGQRPEPDVAYVGVFRDDTGENYYVLEGVEVRAWMVITLVYRPELTEMPGWRVHGMGEPIPPEDLPRGPAR